MPDAEQPESEPALAELAGSSHQLVMITGDAPLTACHAAAHVHIVDRPVLILTHRCTSIRAGSLSIGRTATRLSHVVQQG